MIFQARSPSSAYAPLLHSDPDSQDDVTLVSEHDAQSKECSEEQGGVRRRNLSSLVYWACAMSLLCSALNISLLGLDFLSPGTRPSPPLEYASSYVGLKAAARDPSAPPFRPITSFPIGIAQVNASDPGAVYLDTHRWSSTFGTVYPEDRRILASSAESTYIQFWAGDFGMERCALKLMLPPSAAGDVLLSSLDTTLQIWHVDGPVPRGVDFHHLSWRNRPRRGSLLASWILRHNATVESPEFRCLSGSFQAFELSCAGSGCRVDFRQTPKKKDLGFWLVQRQSI